ncbi:MAG: hypothetical protein Q3W81_03455 [Slackia sp.]|uniref:hypothetical protein n=1 Tax=Slackia isoflavoniconvertens TaxID=572010 RepID=UPI0013798756|nr:hypothetical protein [Slackia isoflavoniconvertens]MBB3279270.1 hypothetical protein [Slackia isoflavoniconvertens]MDR4060534.1 hypothetical protein [Slackia sp.]
MHDFILHTGAIGFNDEAEKRFYVVFHTLGLNGKNALEAARDIYGVKISGAKQDLYIHARLPVRFSKQISTARRGFLFR